GSTGLFSPAVRKRAVREPEMVGRAAGLMLDADFGITGTVEPLAGKTEDVLVRLRGGQLGPVTRFVKQDDVFAVATIRATTRPATPSGGGQASGRASATSFNPNADWANLTLGADHRYRAARPLSNVACVTVSIGSRLERFPVAVLGPDPVTLTFAVSEEDEQLA